MNEYAQEEAQQLALEENQARIQTLCDDYVSDILYRSKDYRDSLETMMGGGAEWEEFITKMSIQLYADALESYNLQYK